MKLKLILLTILSVVGFSLPVKTLAIVPTSAPLEVRLGLPKSPTNQDSFKLTFVALQIGGEEKIAVDCEKKAPSDGGFVKFEDRLLIAGGNTDYCTVTSSILNEIGKYSFRVIARVGSQTKYSSEVFVDHNTSGPSAPVSYSKEKLNSCDYKIKFKAANDGKTKKIEIFRSDSLTISINPESRISAVNIDPDKDGEITNSVPTCGKEYYYAIRAVDSADNTSGIIGDSFTKVIYETDTKTTTTTAGNANSAIAVNGGSQVNGGTTAGDTGEEITGTSTPSAEPSTTGTNTPTPEVLGSQSSKSSNLKWLSVPLILIAAYFFLKAKKRA